METLDALTFFALGLSLGFFLGAYVRKADRDLEFEKGRLHGLNQLWPHFVAATAARVYLAQARLQRHRGAWHATLLTWAAKCRRAHQRSAVQ